MHPNHKGLLQFIDLITSMRNNSLIRILTHAGKDIQGVVQSIEREDDSGVRWNVRFDTKTVVFFDETKLSFRLPVEKIKL